MSKLYTKEMFLIAAEKCEVSMIDANHIIKYIDEYVTPIEIPSDEECIEKGFFGYASNFGENCNPEGYTDKQIDRLHGFIDGAEWVINKIKGGNNE